MKLAALFSGGKDSTYCMFQSVQEGHSIECLLTVAPKSQESMLLHHPNIRITKLQSRLMDIPQIYAESDSDETETGLLARMLKEAKEDYGIEGLVQGGISSEFQKKRFAGLCGPLGLELVSPIWGRDQKKYMRGLLESGFRFIITSVSAGGLDDSWLGEEICCENLDRLERSSVKFGFNLAFEGGEAETLVTGCPMFAGHIRIIRSRKVWDGYRGRFEIEEAELVRSDRRSKNQPPGRD